MFLGLLVPAACTDRGDVGTFGADAGAAASEAGVPPFTGQVTPSNYALAAGGTSTCALKTDGTAVCWGENTKGTLGSGSLSPQTSQTPVPVKGLSGVRSLTGGPFAACALLDTGKAWCWGESLIGEIAGTGGDDIAQTPTPQDMNGLSNDVARVGFGSEFACALTTSGQGKCWGLNGAGQLGNGSTKDEYAARDIASTEPLVDIATGMGGLFACGVAASGKVQCWGTNDSGQLGDGTTTDSPLPVAVAGVTNAVGVTCGRAHACARLADGTVTCWGDNRKGQLDAPGLGGVTFLSAGSDHTCVIANGAASCWGDNSAGQIKAGAGTKLGVTEIAPASFRPIAVSGGFLHTCTMNADRHVLCVGDNTSGQLGAGDFTL